MTRSDDFPYGYILTIKKKHDSASHIMFIIHQHLPHNLHFAIWWNNQPKFPNLQIFLRLYILILFNHTHYGYTYTISLWHQISHFLQLQIKSGTECRSRAVTPIFNHMNHTTTNLLVGNSQCGPYEPHNQKNSCKTRTWVPITYTFPTMGINSTIWSILFFIIKPLRYCEL